jgi:hypothetical protein
MKECILYFYERPVVSYSDLIFCEDSNFDFPENDFENL